LKKRRKGNEGTFMKVSGRKRNKSNTAIVGRYV
jgi:hypothetical protein